MDAIHVTVNFSPQGDVTPLSFAWRGQLFRIDTTGRQWDDEHGRHVMVMTEKDHVCHLLFDRQNGVWYLLKCSHNGHLSVA